MFPPDTGAWSSLGGAEGARGLTPAPRSPAHCTTARPPSRGVSCARWLPSFGLRVHPPVRKKKGKPRQGHALFPWDAPQKGCAPFLLRARRLETLSHGRASFKGGKYRLLFWGSYAWLQNGGFYYYRRRRNGYFGDQPPASATQPLSHSPLHPYFYTTTLNYL